MGQPFIPLKSAPHFRKMCLPSHLYFNTQKGLLRRAYFKLRKGKHHNEGQGFMNL